MLLNASDASRHLAGLLLISNFPYAVRELIFGWLLFAALFAFVALIIFGSVVAWHAAENIIRGSQNAPAAGNPTVNPAKTRARLLRFRHRVFSS